MRLIRKCLVLVILFLSILIFSAAAYSETITYTYDDLNRLIKVKYSNGLLIEYAYDEVGNRMQLRQDLVYTISITRTGTGTGAVTSTPAGMECGTACEKEFSVTDPITLTATPDACSDFIGWSGACSGTGPCTIQLSNQNVAVTAQFNPKPIIAQFSAAPTTGEAPMLVSITNQSLYCPVAWNWSFGDGTVSGDFNGTVLYINVFTTTTA